MSAGGRIGLSSIFRRFQFFAADIESFLVSKPRRMSNHFSLLFCKKRIKRSMMSKSKSKNNRKRTRPGPGPGPRPRSRPRKRKSQSQSQRQRQRPRQRKAESLMQLRTNPSKLFRWYEVSACTTQQQVPAWVCCSAAAQLRTIYCTRRGLTESFDPNDTLIDWCLEVKRR